MRNKLALLDNHAIINLANQSLHGSVVLAVFSHVMFCARVMRVHRHVLYCARITTMHLQCNGGGAVVIPPTTLAHTHVWNYPNKKQLFHFVYTRDIIKLY